MRKSVCPYSLRTACWRRWRGVVRRFSPPPHRDVVHRRWRTSGGSTRADECVAPAWQRLVETIQEAAAAHDTGPWWRFCQLWHAHFPRGAADSFAALEKELLPDGEGDATAERVPRDLQCLPGFLQALAAAVQLGEARLRLMYSATDECSDPKDAELLRSVILGIRAVVFYVAQTRLTHTLYAMHDKLAEEISTHGDQDANKDIILQPLPSRDEERVSHMGLRLTPEEMQQALVLADTSAALLAIDPPVALLPTLYRLLLPAVGACEQLDHHRLAALATAMARSADFEDSRGDNTLESASTYIAATAEETGTRGEALRPIVTSYTVLSHLHALARALEVRMREAMRCLEGTEAKLRHASTCNAQLQLLSLKERKALERKQKAASDKNGTSGNGGVDAALMESAAVVCSALSARRYADDRFWNCVTEFTVSTLRASTSPLDILQDVRDVLFALDYVRQKAHFDRIMTLLVDLHLLQEPIAPPSATRDAMKTVKGPRA